MRILMLFTIVTLLLATSCYKDETLDRPVKTQLVSNDSLDIYIQENFTDIYNIAVRYKYLDNLIEPGKRVTPPKYELVKPMLEFLNEYWIEPFISVPNGETFFKRRVPSEIVFIGSAIYNNNGTITLGTADAGARITITQVNDIDIQNEAWVLRQLETIYHEFAHIVHQTYNLPPNWNEITPQGYTSSGSWYNLTNEEALERGFVSPYATSSANEDFAETVAFLLSHKNFFEDYINEEQNCNTATCTAANAGKAKLAIKYNAVLKHYKQYTGVDLLEVRKLIQDKL